jgi:hypothetical protein
MRLGAERQLRIGIDFDNTLINYDAVFAAEAIKRDFLPPDFAGDKRAIRDAIRLLGDGELAWQHLQGYVYGRSIGGAAMFAGATDFLCRCRLAGHLVFIVSHKTEYANFDPQHVNLRRVALDWMEAQGLFDPRGCGIAPANVHFESTRADKLKRIGVLQCTHFIDDLVEVLFDADFPPGIARVLFAANAHGSTGDVLVCPSWRRIADIVLGETR